MPRRVVTWAPLLLLSWAAAVAVAGVTQHTLSLSLQPNAASPTSPAVVGVNAGHRALGEPSYVAFMNHLGVNGYRLFGLGGIGNQAGLRAVATSGVAASLWGCDMRGAPVVDAKSFAAAVATLRSPAGRDPSQAASFAYPPAWAAVEANAAAAVAGDATSGAPAATVRALQAELGLLPLAVLQLGCGSFTFSTLDASNSTYWAEHWEVYKHTYVVAAWAWARGITRVESHNEPDLSANNACLPDVADVPGAPYWSDYYVLRNTALNAAYDDRNAGAVAAGAAPLRLQLHASAFASVYFRPGDYSGISFALHHAAFPPGGPGVNVSAFSGMNAYSLHSYGKSGSQLASALGDVRDALLAAHAHPGGAPAGPIPVALTEYAPTPNANWQTDTSSSDTPYRAARFASQLLYSASSGFDSYAFKFSMQPYGGSSTMVAKSGLHFAENGVAPYSVGDVTTSGAALALLAPVLAGAKPLLTCAGFASAYQPCVLVRDGGAFVLLLANDYATADGAPERTLSIPLAPLGVPASSFALVSQVAPGFCGEVALLTRVAALPGATLALTMPPWAVVRVTVPAAAQSETLLAPDADATLAAGANMARNYGGDATLRVTTAPGAVHDGTAVALLRFPAAALASAGALSAAILELTVAAAPAAGAVVLAVVGINPSAPRNWSESGVTWAAADWAVAPLRSGAAVVRVAHNFARLGPWEGNGNWMLGHVTVAPGDAGATRRLDVTRFARAASNAGACSVTVAVVRRVRRNAASPASGAGESIAADAPFDAADALAFWSREAQQQQQRPGLRLLQDAGAAPGACNAAVQGTGAVPPAPGHPAAPRSDALAARPAASRCRLLVAILWSCAAAW